MRAGLYDDITDALTDVADFVDKFVDVVDGPDGDVRPNRAMVLQDRIQRLQEALTREQRQPDLMEAYAALVGLLRARVLEGHPLTGNPYCVDEWIRALKAVAKVRGKGDWADALDTGPSHVGRGLAVPTGGRA